MKTLTLNQLTLILATFLSVALISCQKEGSFSDPQNNPEMTDDEATLVADESTQASASFDDIQDVSMIAADDEDLASNESSGRGVSTEDIRPYLPRFEELRLRLGSCATITVVPNNNTYPKTVTIDFGNGCLCADGKFRKGAIIVFLTGPIRRSGSVMTVTLRDFFLNRAHIEGTKTVSNLSANGNIKFTVQVTGGKLTFPNGRGYQYQSMKFVKQIEGGGTRLHRDDVFSIEGRSQTAYNGGLTITLDTDTPLIKKVNCPWINQGILKIKINRRVLFLDFGVPNNGSCDNKALLSWNNGNNQRLITLP